LVPYLESADELKTKPTQHSVKELRSVGITPDIIVLRTSHEITNSMREKIALFCDVKKEAVIQCMDEKILYEVALHFKDQNLDDIVCEHFGLKTAPCDLTEWRALVETVRNLNKTVKIGLVGKYVTLHDAYLSVCEALKHAGYYHHAKVEIKWINSCELTKENVENSLSDCQGIVIPGGFGNRGIDGKIYAITYARTHKVPLLGLCLGLQLSVIEFARNVCNLTEANSTEFEPDTIYNVIDFMPDQYADMVKGGTMRLGLYNCEVKKNTLAFAAYGTEHIKERHRHRYEFNNKFKKVLEKEGMVFSGTNPETKLVEIIELKDHPWFVACQFHPEFLSRPTKPHPLFRDLIGAALKNNPIL
jgi:CTP synthase